jgi:hypothetical protein
MILVRFSVLSTPETAPPPRQTDSAPIVCALQDTPWESHAKAHCD